MFFSLPRGRVAVLSVLCSLCDGGAQFENNSCTYLIITTGVSRELCISKWEKLIILKEYHIEENGTHVILTFLSSSRVPFFKRRTKEKNTHTHTHTHILSFKANIVVSSLH
jgi:hypothetical protein